LKLLMNIGDVVIIKPFYETLEIIEGYGIILERWEDSDGFNWYKIKFEHIFEWFEDYKLELISES
jgi:hypothetical protein